MLARLNADPAIETSYLAQAGDQLLVAGAAGAGEEQVLSACRRALAESNLRPVPQAAELATRAWRERDGEGWLPPAELWRLSWREAETFAARILSALPPEADQLRPLLVASFFESVRPPQGGPESEHWPRGAPLERRRAVLFAAAEARLSPETCQRLRELLDDEQAVDELLRPFR